MNASTSDIVPANAAVLGVGVDLVEIARIQRAVERHGTAFLERVFTQAERDYCTALAVPWASLAARFAAKEAVSKAFGTGFGAELGLTSIGVVSDACGAPSVVLDARGEKLLRERGGSRIHISLTHTQTLAQAFAVLVR
ncbi:MAG: holo-ACP synthase [Puniceicoccales bacterium]|jgi:holo-[acyl-carrier protein] synthase|nr:holo-ACP synthase [Puniceicoccales bacterium]